MNDKRAQRVSTILFKSYKGTVGGEGAVIASSKYTDEIPFG